MLQRRLAPIVLFTQVVFSWSTSAFSILRLKSLTSSLLSSSRLLPLTLHMANTSTDISSTVTTTVALSEEPFHQTVDAFGCPVFEQQIQPHTWIRLEATADPCLREIHCIQDVYKTIQMVKDKQAKVGRCDLYQRTWELVKTPNNRFLEALIGITTVPWKSIVNLKNFIQNNKHDTTHNEATSFSVLQFNTLAEGLSAGPDIPRPFPISTNAPNCLKNAHGGFSSISNPETVLDFNLRRWRVLEVLLEHSPDIMALQEVDRYHGFFGPILCGLFGYTGHFISKPNSPGVKLGWYSDGCALFYKREKFELLHESHIIYKVGSQVGLLATLRHKGTRQDIIVAVTHLKASAENEEIRCAQTEQLLEEIEVQRKTNPTMPVLLLGDFNADPPKQPCNGSNNPVSAIDKVLQAGYQSAYDLSSSPELFTTYKTRGSDTIRRVIDYISYTGIECTHRLTIPKDEEMERYKLPGLRYPSDHLMIASKFRLLK